jgi:uncharacterized protein (TIGR02594 family)
VKRGLDLMRLATTRAAILLCSAALIGFTGSATARTARHHHHSHHRHLAAHAPSSANNSGHKYAFLRKEWARRHGRKASSRRRRTAVAANVPKLGYSSNSLVAEARKYLGTNPTGRRSLWCGAFMDMILRETGHKGGGNLALGYARYGHRVSGPQVGAIAVMGRKGGGHVGVVVGIDGNGNPILISGNHNHTVAESVYPRRRILAYVEPNK